MSIRRAAAIYNMTPNSVSNYLNGRTKFVSDCFAFYQKLLLIEESVLVEYIMRGYYLGYLLTILYFNDCANKLLRMKGVSDIINVH